MNRDKTAEYAEWFIEDGYEEERAWKIARLITKPKKQRTQYENNLVAQSIEEYRENTVKLLENYSYVNKLESDLHCSDWFNQLCSGIEDVLKEKYKDAGYLFGNTDEGFAQWQTKLENMNKMQERLRRIIKESG